MDLSFRNYNWFQIIDFFFNSLNVCPEIKFKYYKIYCITTNIYSSGIFSIKNDNISIPLNTNSANVEFALKLKCLDQ